MIIINITSCPSQLRGDMSKWLSEINTGVYVGKLSTKVRNELWDRICDNIKYGQATMVYSTNSEQGFDFLTYNSSWSPIDYDGIKLMKRPLINMPKDLDDNGCKKGFSKASKYKKAKDQMRKQKSKPGNYVLLDVETTGLNHEEDRIIEVGLIKVKDGEIEETFQALVEQEATISIKIAQMTGITNDMIKRSGLDEAYVLNRVMEIISNNSVVGYNITFDLKFIQAACNRLGIANTIKHSLDILTIARKKIDSITNYRMYTVADYFSLEVSEEHRAKSDCELAYRIFSELNKINNNS